MISSGSRVGCLQIRGFCACWKPQGDRRLYICLIFVVKYDLSMFPTCLLQGESAVHACVSSCSFLVLTDTLEPVCVHVCVPASSLATCTYIPVYVTMHVDIYLTPELHPMHACTGTGGRMFIFLCFVWVHSCSHVPECVC